MGKYCLSKSFVIIAATLLANLSIADNSKPVSKIERSEEKRFNLQNEIAIKAPSNIIDHHNIKGVNVNELPLKSKLTKEQRDNIAKSGLHANPQIEWKKIDNIDYVDYTRDIKHKGGYQRQEDLLNGHVTLPRGHRKISDRDKLFHKEIELSRLSTTNPNPTANMSFKNPNDNR